MNNKITINYKGKTLYIINETKDFYFVSENKNGIKKFAIKKSNTK